ncbi:protein of unknown function [Candidatus Hydrogenisulfobacillus filiaventi]|uniref:Uncharacterized protein n=1 Tax=Candidatus Hydrogenisulfobacillus filiaventi TaxID=2707344 RepID=A0A6F8ZHD9_9FIRM|nr:protein of unknown function [Candidatus Hydrogenisulfobacillus filiaventi]
MLWALGIVGVVAVVSATLVGRVFMHDHMQDM